MFYLALLAGALLSSAAAQTGSQVALCPGIVIESVEKIEFDDTETRMLCGDPELKPWSDIPPYQARFFMRAFLQSRGYLTPEFSVMEGVLTTRPGKKTLVTQIIVSPQSLIEASYVENEIWGLYREKPLTPKLLSALEANVVGLLREKAYACAKFSAVANGENGVVVLNGEHLVRYKFGRVRAQDVDGLYHRALDRFYPLSSDQPFDANKLTLVEKRLVRTGVAQGSYFLQYCDQEDDVFSLSHQIILGPSRMYAFGIGVSTEVGPMFRGRWANNRLGPMASQLSASIQADLKNQSIRLGADNYFWKDAPRRSLKSEFEISREKQVDYEETTIRLASHGKWSRDTMERYWEWRLGPTLFNGSYITDAGGSNKDNTSGLAFEGFLASMSHRFEIFDFLPQEGSSFTFHVDFRSPEFGFDDRLLMLEAEHIALGKLWKWGRGNAVGGLRVAAHTTVVEQASLLPDLPPSVKYYGGGSDDIRGFGYRQLPENNGLGALSKLLAKFELRKTHFFAPALEGFVFYDTAYFGFDSWELSPRLRQSPGLGLRWVSPVGLLQTFVAHGSSTNPYQNEGLVFFVGVGGEF